MQHKTDAEMEDKHDNDEKDQNTQRINNSDKKKENKPLPKSVPLCLATKELIE